MPAPIVTLTMLAVSCRGADRAHQPGVGRRRHAPRLYLKVQSPSRDSSAGAARGPEHLLLGDLRPPRRRFAGHRDVLPRRLRGTVAARHLACATIAAIVAAGGERWLAIVSGLLLALDLNLWHESIAHARRRPRHGDRQRAGRVRGRGGLGVLRRAGDDWPSADDRRRALRGAC